MQQENILFWVKIDKMFLSLRRITQLTEVCSPVDCLPFFLIFDIHVGTFAQEQVHHLQKHNKKWVTSVSISSFLSVTFVQWIVEINFNTYSNRVLFWLHRGANIV